MNAAWCHLRVKPHRALRLEDRVEIEFGDWSRVLVVVELQDRPMPKKEVPRIFIDESLPRPKLDPIDRALRGPVQAAGEGAAGRRAMHIRAGRV